MKRKLSVTITKVRRQATTLSSAVLPVRCPVCHRELETLSEAQSPLLPELAGRTLNDLIDSGRIHDVQINGDGLRVCQGSLLAEQQETETEASQKE